MTYSQNNIIIEKMQYDNLGLFIKEKREKLGVSLNKFGIENNIEPAILSRVEGLKQGTKINFLAKVANGFNMTLGQFLLEYEKSEYFGK